MSLQFYLYGEYIHLNGYNVMHYACVVHEHDGKMRALLIYLSEGRHANRRSLPLIASIALEYPDEIINSVANDKWRA